MAANGSLARSSGATASSRLGTAAYSVTFDQDVTGCAYIAQIGSTGAAGAPQAGFAQTGQTAGVPGGVTVYSFGFSNGTFQASDQPFHLAVFC